MIVFGSPQEVAKIQIGFELADEGFKHNEETEHRIKYRLFDKLGKKTILVSAQKYISSWRDDFNIDSPIIQLYIHAFDLTWRCFKLTPISRTEDFE